MKNYVLYIGITYGFALIMLAILGLRSWQQMRRHEGELAQLQAKIKTNLSHRLKPNSKPNQNIDSDL